jgi:hypothetical protein
MPRYILKHYHRESRSSTVGRLVGEWSIDAANVAAAVAVSEKELLIDFRLPEDFATMWDENGKHVWHKVAHA